MIMFCIMLYVATGMLIFFIEMKTLESLGVLNFVLDKLVKEFKEVADVSEEEEESVRSTILISISFAYIILWPIVLIMRK